MRRLAVCLGGAVLAAGFALGGSGTVTASPSSVAEVAAQLDTYEAEQAALDQRVTDLQQRLDLTRSQLEQTRATMAVYEAEIADLETQVIQVALQQWQSQGVNLTLTAFAQSDFTAVMDQLTASQWVVGNATALLDTYTRERATLEALQASEAAAVAQIEADQAETDRLVAEANQKVQDSQNLLNRLTAAEMKSLNSAPTSSLNPGDLKASAGLIKPVDAVLTSPFGYRINPILGTAELHDGADYGAACGAPVAAAAGGRVTDVLYYGGYGNRVVIDHGVIDGHHYVTAYNHLSGFAVTKGAVVNQGDTVAYVGTTGLSTGCHLHFIVWVDGELVDGNQLV
ncbi:MAG: peptidoglycan DD-metalloendopeptidase family protein [Propionibacteriaceae bacterium]|jgi:murein DD-endopeptidase MepM/ murein hydrolase activator NlpD|nr:peptidoglycan DD-metalloendopeptidase family protein [Propionibacteriaceae bacterium]